MLARGGAARHADGRRRRRRRHAPPCDQRDRRCADHAGAAAQRDRQRLLPKPGPGADAGAGALGHRLGPIAPGRRARDQRRARASRSRGLASCRRARSRWAGWPGAAMSHGRSCGPSARSPTSGPPAPGSCSSHAWRATRRCAGARRPSGLATGRRAVLRHLPGVSARRSARASGCRSRWTPDDGSFEIVLVERSARLSVAMQLPKLRSGRARAARHAVDSPGGSGRDRVA